MAARGISLRGVRIPIRQGEAVSFVLSLPLLVLSVLLIRQVNDPVWPDPMYVACALLHGMLLLRIRHTWLAFGLGSAACLLLMAAPDLVPSVTGLPGALPAALLPSALLFPVLLSSAAAHARSNTWLALVVGIAGVFELVSRLWFGLPWLFVATGGLWVWRAALGGVGLVVILLAWTVGRWRGMFLDYRGLGEDWRHLAGERDAAHLDRAVVEQQARMAREIHGAIAGNLDDIIDRAHKGRVDTRRAPGLADEALAEIAQRGEEALGRVRSLIALLDDPDPEEVLAHDSRAQVLAPEHDLSPQPQLTDLPRLINAARDEGLAVTLDIVGERGRVGVTGELAAYRTVQEALTNTVRHAGPGAVATVQLAWLRNELVVTVEDTQHAAPPPREGEAAAFEWEGQEPRYVEGRGLRIVRERLETLGGDLEIEIVPNGFCTRAIIPRQDQPAQEQQAAWEGEPNAGELID
ncbi:ATP-binding protein [Gephyromycinifex aptenodytis]|uniref:ATP-binding protein n=1 Tax=Gephyromycinifex aptenodytis TaxID=2716227 RepID=UPI001445B568|nr:ATP-binding protein [Gephyromycinifex aptenodytis]